jgi:hypothetical protein
MEVIAHQAIAAAVEWIAVLDPRERFEEGSSIAVIRENIAAVVAPIESVVDEPALGRAR